jgi:hypothetical protein
MIIAAEAHHLHSSAAAATAGYEPYRASSGAICLCPELGSVYAGKCEILEDVQHPLAVLVGHLE